MRDRKVIIVFLVAGIVFIGIGFVLGFNFNRDSQQSLLNSNKDSQPLSDESVSKGQSKISESEVLSESASSAVRQQVMIEKVLDGDTIQTTGGEQIRYIGINAPEKGESYFEEALKFNENLVLGKDVGLEFDVEKIDRYGRMLAYAFVGDTLINIGLARNGLAVTQTIQPNVKYQDSIVAAQKDARERCLGIWQGLCNQDVSLKDSYSGCIKIGFINYDAEGNDNQNKNNEWIEIVNSCSISVQLDDWILKDTSTSNRYRFKDFALGENSNVYIYSGCGENSDDKLYWKCPEGRYAIWNNTGDHAFLYNEKGELVAEYGY